MRRPALAILALGTALAAPALSAEPAAPPKEGVKTLNGFALPGLRVPFEHLAAGGPKRDEIASVTAPKFASLEQATWVLAENPVIGVSIGGESRVYPVHLIERHQIVNDVVGGTPVAVTYDPLAGAPIAYERTVDGKALEFGVAGILYNANFLMYDRSTQSLWSQFRGDSVAGPFAGKKLKRVPSRQETLAGWLERHPDSKVLAPPSDKIDYRYSPFSSYWVSAKIPGRVDAADDRFHPKEVVLGVARDGKTRAYLGSLVTAAGGKLDDEFAGRKVRIAYDSEDSVFRYDVPGDVVVTESYWFAWKAFHPDTEVWHDPGPRPPQ
jgi:hypothetical protein